ncbi:NAD(P)/FAD-dependent oxidoreductase [Nitratireductor thuwali]|uniref:Gamma-glutamylputrescine oxidoreductase n=1 Tax=Nitratireductor thuwali TaxID=2267699 RepID=A0ABY5MDN8_9HYPH|nr:Gamma-glutamylputrescine oxidoreductase [Nitratireductor thuwali]
MERAPDTLWHAVTGPAPAFGRLDPGATAEVAVIGGGFAGLSSALALAQRGVEVLLLEAHAVGWGASGRNAGFVVPNFSKADPAAVVARLGKETGERLLELVGQGADRVFAFARAAGLGWQAEQNGWLQPAHSAAAADMLRKRVEAWRALGRPVEWIDAAETARRTGMDIYHGALADRSGGVINPLAYARALARAAAAAGARIVEDATVTDVRPADGDGWHLATTQGAVRAGKVLLCTNAEEAGVAARLAWQVIPLNVYQIATEPLTKEAANRFSPHREPVSDTRANIFTFRLDADNRLISGGMAIVPLAAERRMGARIVRRLARELGLSDVPRVTHVWRGTAAVTPDFLPRIVRFGDGFFGATGCNGRGIAMTTMFGDVLADAVTGAPPDALPVPVSEPASIPFRPIARAAPSAFLVRGILDDWRTTRRTAAKATNTSTLKGEIP